MIWFKEQFDIFGNYAYYNVVMIIKTENGDPSKT